jgi:hypothetical protein
VASIEEHFQSLLSGALEAAFEGRSEEELQGFLESDGIGRFLDKTIPEVSLSLANSLVESTPEMIAGRRAEEASTAEQMRRTYEPGLDLVEAVLKMADETAEEFVDRHFKGDDGVHVTLWVLAHLQARACRIAEEALVLLKAGYGLGAYARWRSLHEIVVVGSFISQRGEDMALRYFNHIEVDRWRQLLATDDSARSTQEEKEALAKAQVLVDELEHRYGSAFLTDYGWAADAVAGGKHRGFRAIEHAADFGHLRFNYRNASGGIHASAGMVLTPPDARDPYSTMIAGPSLLAIATPAHAVALSLCVSTSTLLTSTPKSAGVFVISAMSDIASRAGDLLVAAETGVEQRVAAEAAIQEHPERGSE